MEAFIMDLVVVNFMEDNQAGVSRLISEFLHRPVTDLNQEIVNLSGQTMDELTMSRGEETLRLSRAIKNCTEMAI